MEDKGLLTISDVNVLGRLMEDGRLDRLLETIKQQTALEIIGTEPSANEQREDLYNLTKALDAVQGKLQECVNLYITQETNDVY